MSYPRYFIDFLDDIPVASKDFLLVEVIFTSRALMLVSLILNSFSYHILSMIALFTTLKLDAPVYPVCCNKTRARVLEPFGPHIKFGTLSSRGRNFLNDKVNL